MKKLVLIFIAIIFSLKLDAQLLCDYHPIAFTDRDGAVVQPVWQYVSKDPNYGEYYSVLFDGDNYEYYLGMDHIRWDGGSFVQDNYLYSLSQIDYAQDLAGYFMEKIDIQTGELIWQIANDPTRVEYREKPIQIDVIDGKVLRMRGVAITEDEISFAGLLLGRSAGSYFIREYDMVTGELLYEHHALESPDPFQMKSLRTDDINFLSRDTIEYLDFGGLLDVGVWVTRVLSDSLGQVILERDTVILGVYNEDRGDWGNRNIVERAPTGDVLFIESFYPASGTELEIAGQISLYDPQFQVKKTVDLIPLIGTYRTANVVEMNEDHFVFNVCDIEFGPGCHGSRFIVMDYDLNILRTVKGHADGQQIYEGIDLVTDEGLFVFAEQYFDSGEPVEFKFYQENLEGSTTLFNEWQMNLYPNYNGDLYKMIQLPDGDFLLKFWYGCTQPDFHGIQQSFNEWMRIAKEDMVLLSSDREIVTRKSDFKLYPNPTSGLLTLEIEAALQVNRVIVRDALGRSVYEKTDVFSSSAGGSVTVRDIDVSHLDSGMYYLSVVSGDGVVYVKSIVKH